MLSQRQLPTKKKSVDVFLYRQDDALQLHFVVIADRLEWSIDLAKAIPEAYGNNNQINNRKLNFPYSLMKTNVSDIMNDPYHQRSRLRYQDIVLTLPTDPEQLLRLILAMDNAKHSMLYHDNKSYDTLGKVYYNEKIPDLSKRADLIYNAFIVRNEETPVANAALSRHIIGWLAKELKNDPAHEALVKNLEELLKVESNSLSRAIRNQLYPDIKLKEFLETAKKEDPLYSDMLNPEIHYVTVSQKLIQRMSEKLSTKLQQEDKPAEEVKTEAEQPPQQAENQLDEEDRYMLMRDVFFQLEDEMEIDPDQEKDDPEKLAKMDPVHVGIKKWFQRFRELRNEHWRLYIATLLGLPSPDGGGVYSTNYTEIDLLNQSRIRLNERGLMELEYRHTPSYRRNYTIGGWAHDYLEEEVRTACGYLGLEFLPNKPNEDFYTTNPVFTEKSTLELLNRGFHYSEDVCKALMRTSHRFKIFGFKELNPKLSLDMQTNIIFRAARLESEDAKRRVPLELEILDVRAMKTRNMV